MGISLPVVGLGAFIRGSGKGLATESVLHSRWLFGAVALLAIVFFSLTNLPWALDEYSQERQALASYDIMKEGRWLYQQAPRDRDATKPPLIPWISAGLYGVTRSWDVAWRLPSFGAAIALAWLIFRIARERFGKSAGLLALSAFVLNMVSPRLATLVRTDMPLALVVFLIGWQIWNKIETGEPWNRRDRWLMFLLLTIGAFIKGPIIYVFLLPGIALFQWRWRKEKVGQAWCGWWPWLWSLGLFLTWVIGGLVTQPGFFDQVIMHEFFGRFSTAEQRPHPPYYYVGHLLHKFAPWSELLLILAALNLGFGGGGKENAESDVQNRKWRIRDIRVALARMSPGVFWLLGWSLGGLLVMSLVPSKRLDRIFPLIPPLCLLIAAQVSRTFPNESVRRRTYRWSAVALALSFLLTSQYSLSKVIYGYRDHGDALVTFGRQVRSEARLRHWRYEVVTSHDGGMLLYLDKPHFIEPERAVAAWNRGALDALVMRASDAGTLLARLSGATLSPLRSQAPKGERGKEYVLLVRGP